MLGMLYHFTVLPNGGHDETHGALELYAFCTKYAIAIRALKLFFIIHPIFEGTPHN